MSNDEKRKDIIKKHSKLFTNEHFSIDFGDGWLDVFSDLCDKLSNVAVENLKITQAKEKYGGMRVYYTIDAVVTNSNSVTKQIDDIIKDAETSVRNVCEDCGSYGVTRYGSWIKVSCDNCVR